MNEDRLQFWSLYLARFAEGFGVVVYALFPFVDSSASFIAILALLHGPAALTEW